MKKNKKDLVALLELTPEELQRASAAFSSTDPIAEPVPGPIAKTTLPGGGQAGDPTVLSAEYNDELEDTVVTTGV